MTLKGENCKEVCCFFETNLVEYFGSSTMGVCIVLMKTKSENINKYKKKQKY